MSGFSDLVKAFQEGSNQTDNGVMYDKFTGTENDDALGGKTPSYHAKVFDITSPAGSTDFEMHMTRFYTEYSKYFLQSKSEFWTNDGSRMVSLEWIELN